MTTASLRLDPRIDPYRDDPRFDTLLERRVKFEAEGGRMGKAGRPCVP